MFEQEALGVMVGMVKSFLGYYTLGSVNCGNSAASRLWLFRNVISEKRMNDCILVITIHTTRFVYYLIMGWTVESVA